MELKVWLSTTLESATYSENTSTWTLALRRSDGSTRVFHPWHVVLCTGQSGEPRIPTFPGQDTFAGPVYYASQY
jgi:cation diffusion facilitator CzcD-associated flavoprotein CzcO